MSSMNWNKVVERLNVEVQEYVNDAQEREDSHNDMVLLADAICGALCKSIADALAEGLNKESKRS